LRLRHSHHRVHCQSGVAELRASGAARQVARCTLYVARCRSQRRRAARVRRRMTSSWRRVASSWRRGGPNPSLADATRPPPLRSAAHPVVRGGGADRLTHRPMRPRWERLRRRCTRAPRAAARSARLLVAAGAGSARPVVRTQSGESTQRPARRTFGPARGTTVHGPNRRPKPSRALANCAGHNHTNAAAAARSANVGREAPGASRVTPRYPTRPDIPRDTISHATGYPARHGTRRTRSRSSFSISRWRFALAASAGLISTAAVPSGPKVASRSGLRSSMTRAVRTTERSQGRAGSSWKRI
jgi:hypothetical protein